MSCAKVFSTRDVSFWIFVSSVALADFATLIIQI